MTIDLELTNHCNARCSFCPRDAMPDQGMMTPRIFARALERAVEFRAVLGRVEGADDAHIVFCGTGESLLNPHIVEFVERVTAAGFTSTLSTNGALLDPSRAIALVDAGLGTVVVNASDLGDDYERTYHLPFARTRDNLAALVAGGRCVVWVSIVDHAADPERVERVMAHWRELGVTRFLRYDRINRGGSLAVDGMDFAAMPEVAEARALLAERGLEPVCGAPFVHMFVGFDGRYYLCSSDWRKQVALGTVFDTALAAATAARLARVQTRSPLCARCSLDPVNRLAAGLRTAGTDVELLIAEIATMDRNARTIVRELAATAGDVPRIELAARARPDAGVAFAEPTARPA